MYTVYTRATAGAAVYYNVLCTIVIMCVKKCCTIRKLPNTFLHDGQLLTMYINTYIVA